MVSNVVDLQTERENRSPHVRGPALCIGCRHEWEAVSPVGVTELECPQCTTMKGRYVRVVMPATGMIYQCKCGAYEYAVTDTKEAICLNCGWAHNLLD